MKLSPLFPFLLVAVLYSCSAQQTTPLINDLSSTVVDSRSIELRWTEPEGTYSGYRIHRQNAESELWLLIDQIPSGIGQYKAFNLAPESIYSFRVETFSKEQESIVSNVTSAATFPQGTSGSNWIWWEGESFDSNTAPNSQGELSPQGNKELEGVLSAGNGFGLTLNETDTDNGFRYVLSYHLVIPVDGLYYLYARKPWNYSWFGWAFDTTEDEALTIVDDIRNRLEDIDYIQYFPMSWVEIGSTELTAGAHTFNVVLDPSLFKEPSNKAAITQYFYDAFMASTTSTPPSSILKPGAKLAKTEVGKWSFEPDPDLFSSEAKLDLRYLNENIAGENGFIRQVGDKFVDGNGALIRFFGFVQGNSNASYVAMRQQAEFYAKRGVNLVRFHTSGYDNQAESMGYIKPNMVDNLQRTVAAFKESGIYTKASHYFVLGLRINPKWGIDGYTEEWVSGNNRAPFGVMFWDEKMTAAYKDWMVAIYGSENPYTGTRLADDPALAIVEFVNEDNVFFWTHNIKNLPPEQLSKLQGKFHDWVLAKHGSIADAYANWGSGSPKPTDNIEKKLLAVSSAGDLPYASKNGGAGERMKDMIQFYGELQRTWYADMKNWMQDTLGLKCVFTASNWQTTNNQQLLDLERYTYTAAGVIDLHNYFSLNWDKSARNQSWVVNEGDEFLSKYAVHNPDEISMAYEQVADHPSFVSEFTWVNPTNTAAEGPIMISALAAMNDIDGFTWFASKSIGWATGVDKWPIANPSLLGQFPGAALMYRRGDLKLAPVVVSEGRSLESLYAREDSMITQGMGYDPTRDSSSQSNNSVDTFAYLVGKVELNFDGDEDVIDTETLNSCINREQGTIRSATGELFFDTNKGYFTLNTPASQGVTGKLEDIGPIELSDVLIESSNQFGAVLVISLEDSPIHSSSRILIQTATSDKPYGWTTHIENVAEENEPELMAEVIDSMGELPFNIIHNQTSVLLKGVTSDHAPIVSVLDENGMVRGSAITEYVPEGLKIVLPINSLYTHVELTRGLPE